MDRLLSLLQENARDVARQVAIAQQNHAASAATGEDVLEAQEGRGHRLWSHFTPPEGRA